MRNKIYKQNAAEIFCANQVWKKTFTFQLIYQ